MLLSSGRCGWGHWLLVTVAKAIMIVSVVTFHLITHAVASLSSSGSSVAAFANNVTISARFVERHNDGRHAQPLLLSEAILPHDINETLHAYAVQWADLGGTIQRLMLWDAGYILTATTSQHESPTLTQVYVACGSTMDEIVLSRHEYESHDCPLRSCDGTFVAAGVCPPVTVAHMARCAVLSGAVGETLPSTRYLWAEEAANGDIPIPSIFRVVSNHSNSDSYYYSIGLQDQSQASTDDDDDEHCVSNLRIAIPCAQFNAQKNDDAKWCVPEPSGAVVPLLKYFYRSSKNGLRGDEEEDSSNRQAIFPLLLVAAIGLVAVFMAAVALGVHRKVKLLTTNLNQAMDGKQAIIIEDAEIKATRDDQVEFIYVHSKDKTLVVIPPPPPPPVTAPPVTAGFFRLLSSELLSSSSSNTSTTCSSSTDLINASPVLLAFQNDPVIFSKRIPMRDLHFSRKLCSGASGDVFLGRVSISGHSKRVAIKQLVRLKKNHLDEIECFAKEIQLTALLHHPNIIQMLGVAWTTFQNLALVLEYRSGGDLLEMIRKKGATWTWQKEKLHIAIGVARAMAYLHGRQSHPLVHRDIKSRNILLDQSTLEPALCDFGSSRNVSTLDVLSTANNNEDLAGTILWSAPEVICAQEYSTKADIFSFGVVLAELDTCALPYTDERDSDGRPIVAFRIAHLVVENQLKPQLTTHCPRFVKELVMNCVTHQPENRPSADEILSKLLDAERDCAALWKSKSQGSSSLTRSDQVPR